METATGVIDLSAIDVNIEIPQMLELQCAIEPKVSNIQAYYENDWT